MPYPHPQPALSLTHDLLRVLSMDTWWTFGHGLKKKKAVRGLCIRGVVLGWALCPPTGGAVPSEEATGGKRGCRGHQQVPKHCAGLTLYKASSHPPPPPLCSVDR